MKQNKINNQIIIDTAFNEWSHNFFKDTSLTLITKKLKITKPALYRYFKNKDELLLSMKKFILIKIKEISESFIIESKKINSSDTIFLFINEYFGFFLLNKHYFMFYVLTILRDSYLENEDINKIYTSLIAVFSDVLKKINTWVNEEQVEHFFRFLISTGIFVILYKFSNDNFENIKITKPEIQDAIKDIYYIVMNGFGSIKINHDIDFDKIEKESIVNNNEITRDKFIDAIASVVAEYGLWDTTIDKIAKKLDFSKSSLYFYFKNKNEMLTNMIIKEIEMKNKIVNNKLANYKKFEEILYSYITSTASYFLVDKRILLVFDWLHFQNINLKKISNKIKIDTFIINIFEEAIKNKQINLNKFDIEFIIKFLNIQIVKEIYYSLNLKKEISLKDLKYIFFYFLNGILKEKT